MVEHPTLNRQVVGSSPTRSTIHPPKGDRAGVAQSVEQLIRNQQVVGSSPTISSSTGEVSEWFKVPLSKSGVV
jgi:hypothetical protein